jgi:hypothetical protein
LRITSPCYQCLIAQPFKLLAEAIRCVGETDNVDPHSIIECLSILSKRGMNFLEHSIFESLHLVDPLMSL